MLGLTPKQIISKTIMGDRQVDLEYGFHDLFGYCDLIQSRYVGDILALCFELFCLCALNKYLPAEITQGNL